MIFLNSFQISDTSYFLQNKSLKLEKNEENLQLTIPSIETKIRWSDDGSHDVQDED